MAALDTGSACYLWWGFSSLYIKSKVKEKEKSPPFNKIPWNGFETSSYFSAVRDESGNGL